MVAGRAYLAVVSLATPYIPSFPAYGYREVSRAPREAPYACVPPPGVFLLLDCLSPLGHAFPLWGKFLGCVVQGPVPDGCAPAPPMETPQTIYL